MGKTVIFLIVALLLAAGVAYPFSDHALSLVDPNITFDKLRENPDAYLGKRLLLGGTIISSVRNRGELRVEVAQLPLDAENRPDDSFRPDGTFIASTRNQDDFSDYKAGHFVSVVGSVSGTEVISTASGEETVPEITVIEAQFWSYYVLTPEYPPGTVYRHYYDPDYYWNAYPYYYPYYPWLPGFWFNFDWQYRSGYRPSYEYRHHQQISPPEREQLPLPSRRKSRDRGR